MESLEVRYYVILEKNIEFLTHSKYQIVRNKQGYVTTISNGTLSS